MKLLAKSRSLKGITLLTNQMTLEIPVYPPIRLPLRLRARFKLRRIMRFAASMAFDSPNEEILLEQKFNEIILRESSTISKICFSYSGSVSEFDDLRQDALINIWRGLQNFRGDATLKTWIYRITVNSCLSTIRKHSRHRHESIDSLYGMIDCDDTDKDEIEQLHRIISTLGAQERAIIMMWLDEMSYDEIAVAAGLNRNTVATRIHRIKEKIAKQYNKEV